MEAALLLGLVAPGAVQDSQSSIATSAEFSPSHRLLREDGFDHVVHAGNLSDKRFKVFFVRNGKKNARLGIIASKRIIPDAAQRNRVKRAIREAFRQHTIKNQHIDMVVMVRSADTQVTKSEGLEALFSRVEDRCASL